MLLFHMLAVVIFKLRKLLGTTELLEAYCPLKKMYFFNFSFSVCFLLAPLENSGYCIEEDNEAQSLSSLCSVMVL